MTHPARRILALAFAATLSTAAAAAQALPNPSSAASTTPANVARVYVQTAKGVNVYTASSTGNLTLVSGSPFTNTAGQMIGFAAGHLITVGAHYLHSYAITSTGGIAGQAAQVNTASYAPPDVCGKISTAGGAIDRSGSLVYIRLEGPAASCDLLQSYSVDTTGAFAYIGAAMSDIGTAPMFKGPLVVSGDDRYAYTFEKHGCENNFDVFYRDASGAMNDDSSFTYGGDGVLFPVGMASDNQKGRDALGYTGHMAIALQAITACQADAPVLASYSVDEYGNLYYGGAVLEPAVNPQSMTINPQGNLLAVAGSRPSTNKIGAIQFAGLQVFHFKPFPSVAAKDRITRYSNLLNEISINSIAWDKSHHLYAISHARNKLYVFTITPTSITYVAGSPFTLSAPSTLVVHPLL